ncbi:MAG: osmY [Verrucomicrobia bacterium]|nr:osmY [Verrucomicrobiota bacterium]
MHRILFPVVVLLAAASPILAGDGPTDRMIEEAAAASYNFRVALENHVKLTVEDGVAILGGKVCIEDQRQLAKDTVESIPGVVRVDDQISLRGPREGSDDWIALKVRCRLLAKANVSLADTRVDVDNGVVTLRGRALDGAQRELTEDYAREIEGVRAVKNEIAVVGGDRVTQSADGLRLHEHNARRLDDISISAQIRYELRARSVSGGPKASIETSDGRVTIAGEVESAAERDLITDLARSVRGVESVENKMTVARK